MTRIAPYPTEDPLSEGEREYLFDLLGYTILKQALSERQLAWINAWVDRQPASKPGDWLGNVEVHSYQGHDGTNYQNITEGGEVFEELIDNPAWIKDIYRYICNGYYGVSINEAFLNIRAQGGFIGVHSGGHLPTVLATTRHHAGAWMVGQLNVLMALTDVGPGDGATVIVPGSHKSDVIHPILTGGAQQAYRDDLPGSQALMTHEVHLKAGDAVLFTDGVCHGSAPRINPGERRILIYRYSPSCVLPRYNYLPSEELLARLTPERRSMIQPVAPRFAPSRQFGRAGD